MLQVIYISIIDKLLINCQFQYYCILLYDIIIFQYN